MIIIWIVADVEGLLLTLWASQAHLHLQLKLLIEESKNLKPLYGLSDWDLQ